ncbi:MAG: NUDIX hydrolase [Acidiferrobacterales bacterium]
MKIIVASLAFACLSGLFPVLAAPGSSVTPQARTDIEAAGCFVPTPDGVVVGISTFGDIRIPMGSHRSGETAGETAIRETREETGLEVRVGRLLRTFENGRVLLFLCEPRTPINDYSQLTPTDTFEIAQVIVLDPVSMRTPDGRKITSRWRFAETRALLGELFTNYKAQNHTERRR